ncbi:uncharacterized protein LOC135958211 [Calliphora vicina]|uniref:uncharacterized protein LOC135958211 n=1 Tax=Calliphora vicina TaxID=7373 RepID=UPI00325BDB0F
MSYQIKSTPYFQRMLTKSKHNGQLQMLKKEYERMNVFDELNIDMKMREVRLKRLFKEIEHIRKCNLKRSHRLDLTEKSKTKEAERLENLKKAKKLGQYFSQRNLRDAELEAKRLLRKKHKLEEKQLESAALKRIKYGNEISDWNRRNIQKEFQAHCIGHSNKLNSYIKNDTNSEKTFCIDRNVKLQHEICYNPNISENSKKIKKVSPIHGKFVNTNDCINFQVDGNSDAKASSVLTLSENVHLIDLETCDKMHEAILIDNESIQLMLSCNTSRHTNSTRAVKNWQKLATFIRIHFGVHRSSKVCDQTNYKATNVDELNNRRLKSNEYLFEAKPFKSLDDDYTMPILSQKSTFLKPTISPEDYYYNGLAEKKDDSKFSVGKLRRFFEHHNE